MDRNCLRHKHGESRPKSFEAGSVSRLLWELAIATGLPKTEWQTAEDIMTTLEILERRNGGG